MQKHLKIVSALFAALFVLSACSLQGSSQAFPQLAERAESSAGIWSLEPQSLEETLPNTVYSLIGKNGEAFSTGRISDLVVTGEFTSSEIYKSSVWNADDSETEVDQSEDADSCVLHLNFAVSETISVGEGLKSASNLVVSVTVDGSADASQIGQDLVDSGQLVVFLSESSDNENDPGWDIALGGSLIGVIESEETVKFPVLDELDSGSSLGNFAKIEHESSLEALRNAAQNSEVVIEID